MTSMNDEVLFATLIELADTTTTGFDLVSMADRLVQACVEVLGVTAAGIMLADQRKSLRVFASSNEETRILELLEIQNDDGPCLEAFHTGTPIEGVDLSRHTDRWPHFAAAAMAAGFNTAYAVPMRLRDQTIGALNLFQVGIETFSTHKINVARVLADMAAIGIINHWSVRQQEVLAQQLQSALNTRVIIEQAKGVLAERQGGSPGEAFEALRSSARASRRPIAEVAHDIIRGQDTTRTGGADQKRPSAEARHIGNVEAAVEIVQAVYLVSAADALDMLTEVSRDLQCSLPDAAAQVVTGGRLPEAAIVKARQTGKPAQKG